jgi:hypothetical protein
MKLRTACVLLAFLSLAVSLTPLIAAQTTAETTSAVSDAAPQSNAAPTIGGGGTKGYVPLWLKPGKGLGNSTLFQTAGEIGIGTTTPSATLDVNGAVNAATSYNLGGTAFAFGSYAKANTFLGFAGNSTMTGSQNTATGYQALYSNTSGLGNTADGYYALLLNTTGCCNVASGTTALWFNLTGSDNTANGFQALGYGYYGNYNTASGAYALWNASGSGNTAVGYGVLQASSDGEYNTAVGYFAGANSKGSNNTAVGYLAGFNLISGSNDIDIGNEGVGNDNGVIRIGTAGTQVSAFIAGIYGETTSAKNAVPVLIDSNGNLGTMSSSRRYKEDIQDMGDTSSGLMRLRPVTFRYKKPFDDGSQPTQYGLIAEEVAEVYPDLVARSADGQIETVKYQLLDPMLLNEVQRQQAEIRNQQSEIRDLQERLSKMEFALAAVPRAPESR